MEGGNSFKKASLLGRSEHTQPILQILSRHLNLTNEYKSLSACMHFNKNTCQKKYENMRLDDYWSKVKREDLTGSLVKKGQIFELCIDMKPQTHPFFIHHVFWGAASHTNYYRPTDSNIGIQLFFTICNLTVFSIKYFILFSGVFSASIQNT